MSVGNIAKDIASIVVLVIACIGAYYVYKWASEWEHKTITALRAYHNCKMMMERSIHSDYQDWLRNAVLKLNINESAVKVPVKKTVCLEWGEKEVCEGGIIMAGKVPIPTESCYTKRYCKKYGTVTVYEISDDLVCKELLKKAGADPNEYYCDMDIKGSDCIKLLYRLEIEIEPKDKENTPKEEVDRIVNNIAKLLKENDLCVDIHKEVYEDTYTVSSPVCVFTVRDLEGNIECYFPLP